MKNIKPFVTIISNDYDDSDTFDMDSIGAEDEEPETVGTAESEHHLNDVQCNGTFTDNEGEIKSPGYPGTYPNEITCEWTVTVSGNRSILLTIRDVQLRAFDKLYVHDGRNIRSKPLVSYRRYHSNKSVVSSGNQIYIRFVADKHYYTKRGTAFLLNYKAVKYGCDLTLNDTQGVIHSPGYPDGYYDNMVCEWTVSVGTNQNIVVMFDDFQTEQDSDFLHVLYTYKKFSGNGMPANFISNTNRLRLKFTTDSAITGRGFKISYKVKEWGTDTKFLIAAHNAILKAQLAGIETVAYNGDKVTAQLMDHNIMNGQLIWYDESRQRMIWKTAANVTTVEFAIHGRPNSLALDWIHDLVYWLDIQSKSIRVLSLDDVDIMYTVCQLTDENPRDLHINAMTSVLVWSDVGWDPKLMNTNLDGSNLTVLYRNRRQAYHLTIDYNKQRYYFIDIGDHSLYSIDFTGNNEIFFMKSPEFFDSLTSMAVLNGDLYLANELMLYRMPDIELRIHSIQIMYKSHRYNVSVGQLHSAVDINRQQINGFKILDPIMQPIVPNSCADSHQQHDCPNICLPIDKLRYRCPAPDSVYSYSELLVDSSSGGGHGLSVDTLSIVNTIAIVMLIVSNIFMAYIIYNLKWQLMRKQLLNQSDDNIMMTGIDNSDIGITNISTGSANGIDIMKSNENLLASELRSDNYI
ncbi:low-density lipoprotein receptor-related protein 1-like [Oppia nitens]|uniref:low-density lipoprotein receptor-related protein 1-like n=1 Tax=Oppia nitens TaxID=1686743 RepID=UPI0023DC4923|nr:low-density lipoprotein receptor-related protein 1-like [Oppia nitens]